MRIDFDYLDRVQQLAALYTNRKTSDLLEGDFHSLQHGRSLDFDDLREYQYGDDVNDIDWKSSSRTGKTLIRRYFADKKHDAIFVADTGLKMMGDTDAFEAKETLALMTFGSAAYLMGKQGINYALCHSGASGSRMSGFSSGANHLEELMYHYQKALESHESKQDLNTLLERTASHFERQMVMFIITDREGISKLNEKLIQRITFRNDVYLISIEDAFLTSNDAYDLKVKKFEDLFLTSSKKLHREEVELRKEIDRKGAKLLRNHKILYKKVSKESEIIDLLIEIFRERREMASCTFQ